MDKVVKFLAILPFKPRLKSMKLTFEGNFSEKLISLGLYNQERFDIISGMKSIDTSHRLIVELEVFIKHSGDDKTLKKRVLSKKQLWSFMDEINKMLLVVKHADNNSKNTKEIRSVGLIDLVYYHVIVDDKMQGRQGNSSYYAEIPALQKEIPEKPENPSNEWFILVRASELIERGYNSEGLLIAFSLLDSCVQEHLSLIMNNLTENESKDLISKVSYDRLRIYLGYMHKALCGTSIIEYSNLENDLKWLNKARNDAIHNAISCDRGDAIRGIEVVIKILSALNDFGSKYKLPDPLFPA